MRSAIIEIALNSLCYVDATSCTLKGFRHLLFRKQ